jgi:hypothetical protein
MNRFDIMLKKTPPPPPTPPPIYTAVIDDGKVNRNGRSYSPGVYAAGIAVYAGDDNRPVGIVTNVNLSSQANVIPPYNFRNPEISTNNFYSVSATFSVGDGVNSGGSSMNISTKGNIGL